MAAPSKCWLDFDPIFKPVGNQWGLPPEASFRTGAAGPNRREP